MICHFKGNEMPKQQSLDISLSGKNPRASDYFFTFLVNMPPFRYLAQA